MDPLHITVALLPLALYLALLAVINLRRRSTVVSGTRDLLWLCLAISGFVIVGPMELFMPEAVAFRLPGTVWLGLLVLYALCVSLAISVSRPRLVIYNIRRDDLRSELGSLAQRLDENCRWAGDSANLPKLGVQFRIEYHESMRNAQLVANDYQQHLNGWKRLQRGLSEALAVKRVSRNPRGAGLVLFTSLFVAATVFSLLHGRQPLAQLLHEMLRL